MSEQSVDRRYLCSLYSRQQQEDPIGSARTVKQFLFVEVPKPWHSSTLRTEHFPDPLHEAYKEARKNNSFDGKFLFVAPDPEYSQKELVRFLYFEQPDKPFSTYRKQSYLIPEDDFLEAGRLLLLERERMDSLADYREDSDEKREILVCTHGERDPCCGEFGSGIYGALRTHYTEDALRVWQVSHIGGHRLCPNVVDLPEGRYWGRLNLDVLDEFVNRKGDFSLLSDRYRGWCALESPVQILERRAFEEHGWNWIYYKKEGHIEDSSSDESGKIQRVKLDYETGSGEKGHYTGTVRIHEDRRRLASPCGEIVQEPAFKPITQYELVEYQQEGPSTSM